jgi:hypothetical protein
MLYNNDSHDLTVLIAFVLTVHDFRQKPVFETNGFAEILTNMLASSFFFVALCTKCTEQNSRTLKSYRI